MRVPHALTSRCGSLEVEQWNQWASYLRGLTAGQSRCVFCGSQDVRRSWEPRRAWMGAFGLTPCHCNACGRGFGLRRQVAPAASLARPADVAAAESVTTAPPVDLAALDRDIEKRRVWDRRRTGT